MFDDLEPQKQSNRNITLGCDLSTFSVADIDERVALLMEEVARLKDERQKKETHLTAAQSFFKS